MGLLLGVYAISMGFPWGSLNCLLDFKGMSMGLPLESCGISMIFLRYSMGILLDSYWISMIFLLDFHDIAMRLLWDFVRFYNDFCGISMVFPSDSHGIPMVFSIWVTLGFLREFFGILWKCFVVPMHISMGFLWESYWKSIEHQLK